MSTRERFIQPSLQILADAPGRAPPDSEPCGKMQRQRPHPTSPSRPVPSSGLARLLKHVRDKSLQEKKNLMIVNNVESAGPGFVGVDEGDRNPERERPLSHLPDEDEDQSALQTSV